MKRSHSIVDRAVIVILCFGGPGFNSISSMHLDHRQPIFLSVCTALLDSLIFLKSNVHINECIAGNGYIPERSDTGEHMCVRQPINYQSMLPSVC